MRLILLKDREITSKEHSEMKKRALQAGIEAEEHKRRQQIADEKANFLKEKLSTQNETKSQETQEKTELFEQKIEQYRSELFYLIQSPERIQMLDDSFKHDVNFVCQAVEFNPLVIDYLDEYMLNNKEVFSNLLIKKENAYLIAKIGSKLSYDTVFLSQMIKLNENCESYINPVVVDIIKAQHCPKVTNFSRNEPLNHFRYN